MFQIFFLVLICEKEGEKKIFLKTLSLKGGRRKEKGKKEGQNLKTKQPPNSREKQEEKLSSSSLQE